MLSEQYRPSWLAQLAAVLVSLVVTTTPYAALTPGKCLAQKAKAWGTFRKCEAAEDAKRLLGKAAALATCTSKRTATLLRVDAKAAKAAIACRFGDNDDATVTDYDTGLQWERKSGLPLVGLPGFSCPLDDGHCVNEATYWAEVHRRIELFNGVSIDGTSEVGGFAGHGDWRLPTNTELVTLLDASVPGCGTAPCIDSAFGPTAAGGYWSETPKYGDEGFAVLVDFGTRSVALANKNVSAAFRIVRGAL